MSDSTRDVTGGDLYSVWQVANIHLPTAAAFYVDRSTDVHGLSNRDTDTFGRAHTWWAQVACEYERALHRTALNLLDTGHALNKAIDAYKYTDESNAAELTAAGEGLESILDDQDLHDPSTELSEDELPGKLSDYRWAPPDDWIENLGGVNGRLPR